MDIKYLLCNNDIFIVRSSFDEYMSKYPSIELYLEYYRELLKHIKDNVECSHLFAYIVDYLFHDSYQNVYVNICEMIRYTNIRHTTEIIPRKNLEFYKWILGIDNWSSDKLLDFFEFYKDKKIYMTFYEDLSFLRDHCHENILNDLTDLTLLEPTYESEGIPIYDLRGSSYKLLIRSSEKFIETTEFNKSWFSIVTSSHNNSYGREYGPISYDYGFLCADKNKILHVSECDLLSRHSKKHDCGTFAPNRLLDLYSITEYNSSWSEIQILNSKKENSYFSLKPDFIISYGYPIKSSILVEAKRLGIPITILNKKSLEAMNGDWLTNKKYNSYYDKSLHLPF